MLVALIVACWAAQPAAAEELRGVGHVAEAPVAQPVAHGATETVAAVETRVQEAVEVASQVPAGASLPEAPAAPSIPDAPAVTAPPAEPSAPAQTGPPAPTKRPATRINTARVDGSHASARRLRATIADPAAEPVDLRPTAAAAPSGDRFAVPAHGSAPPRTAAPTPQEHRPGGPGQPGPALGGAAANASSATFFFGGLALLVGALALAGPRLRRRLVIRPASWRPIGLVLLLERPG